MKNSRLIELLQAHNQEAEVTVSLINPRTCQTEYWHILGPDGVVDPRTEVRFSIAAVQPNRPPGINPCCLVGWDEIV
jgi:hypothetical protein